MERLYGIQNADYFLDTRLVTIIRDISYGKMLPLVEALFDGGIRTLEITMNTSDAVHSIEMIRNKYSESIWVGAGTVLTIQDAERAMVAGAQYFVTPHVDVRVLEFGVRHNIPVFSGALTPSEIYMAYENGASAVKVFPATALGPSYIKDLQGPLRHIPMIAVGGVSVRNIEEYLSSGCVGVGVGGSLIDKRRIDQGRFHEISEIASTMISTIQDYLSVN